MSQNKTNVFIINENHYLIPNNIEDVVKSSLSLINTSTEVSVSVAFIDENEMIKLNIQYNGYAHSTDVLSFESHELDMESGCEFLGDIIICYPFVENQSKHLGNLLDSEILLMVIHGLLHLSGYDHDNDQNKSEMWAAQNSILKFLNIKIQKLPE